MGFCQWLCKAKIIYDNNLTLEEYLNSFGCVLYINKPKDITSFDVVNDISHLFGIKRVGHTGTLDPLATGVMLVTVGKATKIVELLTEINKRGTTILMVTHEHDLVQHFGKRVIEINSGTITADSENPEVQNEI